MPQSNVLIAEPVPFERINLSYRKEPEPVVEYPDSDGAPMGETEFHVVATLDLYNALRHFFRHHPMVYVIADMFLYYKKGHPEANKAPDVMVIKGVPKRKRRTFKVWEEQAVPCVIFEITSKKTMREDTIHKKKLYASLGVREYFLFDPLQEYLEPGFIGLRLADGDYLPIAPDAMGRLFSEELEVWLAAQEDRVRIFDPRTRQLVPDLEEAISAAEQEAQRTEQETQRAEQERRRAELAEAELARLQTLLNQK